MPDLKHVQTNFTAGEISPRMFGRGDVDKYQNGAELIENFFIQEHGGVVRRSGTKHVDGVRVPANMGRLIPFQFSTTQHYVLEFCDKCIRFYKDNAILTKGHAGWDATESGGTAIAALKAGVPITGGHQWKAGTKITTSAFTVSGYNTTDAIISAVSHNTISYPVSGGPANDFSGTGVVTAHYEIDAPWAVADVFKISYTQSADFLYIGCPGYKSYILERLGDTNWRLAELQWAEQSTTYRNTDESLTMDVNLKTGATIVVTASAAFFNANHVGNWIRIWHGGAASGTWGWARIKTFNSNVSVDAEERRGSDLIGKAFGDNTNPSRFWRIFQMNALDGPYNEEIRDDQWTIDSAQTSAENDTLHVLTATQDTFTANDVGRSVRLFKKASINKWGVFVITEFVSATEVNAWMVNDLEQGSGDWVPQRNWRLGAWNDADGWPQIPHFHQNRLWWAKSANLPETFWGSRVNAFESYSPFDPLTNGLVTDKDAFQFTASAGASVSDIRWMVAMSRGMVLGTAGGVFLVAGGEGRFSPITPTNIGVAPNIFYGAQQGNYPVRVGSGNVIYPQLGGEIVREVSYSFNDDGLIAIPISLLAEHVTVGGLVRETAYMQQPNSIVWFMRNDGQLPTLVHEPRERVVGWSRQILGGTLAGENHPIVESFCVVHNDPDDELWLIVKRTIDGADVRHVEYLTQIRKVDDRIDDAFYVDDGKTQFDSKAITGITQVNPVVVTSTAHGFSDGDVVRIRTVKGTTEVDNGRFKIAEKQADDFELASIAGKIVTAATQANPGQVTIPAHGFSTGNEIHFHDIAGMTQLNGNGYTVTVVDADNITIGVDTSSGHSAYTSGGTGHLATNGSAHTAYVSGGTAAKQIASITGADHLEGETVKILADGAVHPDVTVSSGTITLNSGRDASKIQYGLAYTSKLKLLPTIPAGTGYEPRGRLYLPRAAKVRFNQTVGGEVGIEGDLAPLPFRTNELMGEPPAVFSGVHEVDGVQGEYTLESQLVLQQTAPMPMSVLSATIELSLDES